MYEHKRQRLIPITVFYTRVLKNLLIALLVMIGCLLIGILGYQITEDMKWIDALHNASMILSGMGLVMEIKTNGGKIFSSVYAIFSGVVFITNIGNILVPALHRIYHRLHLEDQ
jgi:hypothetical protein